MVAATVGLLVLAIAGMAVLVQKQFFPRSNRPEVLVSVYLPQGSSIGAADRTMKKIEAILSPLPEVKSLSAYVGAGAPRFFISASPEPPNPAFAQAIAVARDAQARDRVMATLKHHIEQGDFPEARVRVYRLLYGPPVLWPLSFRVIGPDPLLLRAIAHQVRTVMAADPRVLDPHLEWDERAPTPHLAMDVERLQLLGLTPQDVAEQLQFQVDGALVTQVRQDIRAVDVIARGARAGGRFDAERLGALEVLTRDGRKLPASQLGRFQIRFEDPVIKRYNREPFVAVQADVQGAQPNAVTATLWAALAPVRAQLPPGYRIDIAGAVEESGKADASIQRLQPVMLAFMLIFIMLQMRSFAGSPSCRLPTTPSGGRWPMC